MKKILIVEDDEAPAELATKFLKEAFNCEVDLAKSPDEGIARLHRTSYDVALVDMLFRSHSLEFLQRLSSRKVELSDSVLHQSGLAVLRAIQKNKLATKPILWTFGDANRYLHIIFAHEELGCRVFCTKDNIRNLPEAVNRAAAGKEHRDSLLQLNQRSRGSKSLRETILATEKERKIWRAMALGYGELADIERVFKVPRVRKEVGDMRKKLQQLNPNYIIENKPAPALIAYASSNWEFFLDDTVKEMFP